MSRIHALFTFMLVCLILSLVITPGYALPPLPSNFNGQIKINGQNVPDGTKIEALIGGIVYNQAFTITNNGTSLYSLDVPGDDPSTVTIEGGKEGDPVQFRVANLMVVQTGLWHSGVIQKMDINLYATFLPVIQR